MLEQRVLSRGYSQIDCNATSGTPALSKGRILPALSKGRIVAGSALVALGLVATAIALQRVHPDKSHVGLDSAIELAQPDLDALSNSKFVTNAKHVKRFKLNNGTRSLLDAFKDAFPDERSWWPTSFSEGHSPKKTYSSKDVALAVVGEIMAKPPFKDDLVPIPFTQEGGEDQLLPGEYVGYTRRQVCYLAAKALMGATFDGYNDGLSRYLSKEGPGGCLPRKGAFGKVLWSLLMSCVADPSLQDEKPGPELLVVKQQPVDMSSERLQQLADMTSMSGAALRVCRYEEGSVYKMGFLPGVPKSPPELCSQPSTQRGVDYLSTSAMGQAAVLPSSRVGGQIYGSSCGGGGLDENIMLFMPEVAVLSLLLSESKTQPQLQAPAWVLGARMIMTGLDGTGHWMAGMVPDAKLRLTSDLTTIHLNGAPLLMSKSKPFVAVPPAFQVSFQDVDDLKEARQNRNLDQRAVKGQNSFAAQVMAWYQALSLDAVPPALRRSMPSLVSSIGTGPWMSGSRFRDSQLDVLSIWLGQALVAKTWTGHLLSDYYLYSYFTENPGNQCFLHSSSRCGDCLWTCSSKQFPPGSFYLQDKGFMSQDHSKPCVLQSEFACPSNGIETIFWNFGLKPASELWKTLEKVLIEHKDQNTRSVFDRLFDELSSSLHQKLDPYAGKAATS